MPAFPRKYRLQFPRLGGVKTKTWLWTVLAALISFDTFSQVSLSGKVLSERDSLPVTYATVSFPLYDLVAVTDEKGEFRFSKVPAGQNRMEVRYLGFAPWTMTLDLRENKTGLNIYLSENDLSLDEVLVTAQQEPALNTAYTIDRAALDHLQMQNVTDVASLLPGGKTNQTQHLATSAAQTFAVNGTSAEAGNAIFGVAVELDGIRLSNNTISRTPGTSLSSPSYFNKGTDVRNIAPSNIESIEIVTGIPSVEYSDLSNGMVRINTRKGSSPYILEMSTRPNTKQVALSKGFQLGPNKGVLNFNFDHAKSIANPASPFTSYARNGLSLNYGNTFNPESTPVIFNIGLMGNLGGYDDSPDPDLFVNTYSKQKDQVLRANVSSKWLLNKSWITNLELSGSVNYNNLFSESQTKKSSSSSVASIRTSEEGYHVGETYASNPDAPIILIPPGYWYQQALEDSRLINYTAKAKATWAKKTGLINHKILAGAEYNGNGNLGRGVYYGDPSLAPTWRAYRYDEVSFANYYGFYAEDRATVALGESELELLGGARWDIGSVNGSDYGTVSSLSPRFNAAYAFPQNFISKIQELRIRAGWGKTVKMPSFNILYPEPSYRDILTFSPGTTAQGETFYAYYTTPVLPDYNPELRWQQNSQLELGLDMKVKGAKIQLTYSRDLTRDPYSFVFNYSPFTYKYTDQSNLENSAIPSKDRIYSVDEQTGIVQVSDINGLLPTETLGYREITRYYSTPTPSNGSDVKRNRVRWIIDFDRFEALRTQLRIDGNFYHYEELDERLLQSMPNSTLNLSDGRPYNYVGLYVGGNSLANGSTSKSLDINLTTTTHIPALNLIFTFRLEGSYYKHSQNLSDYSQGQRGYVLDSKEDYLPSENATDIYAGDQFVAIYPEYYYAGDGDGTLIPFLEKFIWAKDNDPALYNDLSKLVNRTNYSYYFNEAKISPYVSANLGVTKEIGKLASVSFNATNFYNNLGKVHSTQTGAWSSLFGSSAIPSFYYSLSLRLKL